MKPYTPNTNHGRTVGQDDIHHRTADQPKRACKLAAKTAKHSARQHGKKQATDQLDCREVLPLLPRFACLATDPPYGLGDVQKVQPEQAAFGFPAK